MDFKNYIHAIRYYNKTILQIDEEIDKEIDKIYNLLTQYELDNDLKYFVYKTDRLSESLSKLRARRSKAEESLNHNKKQNTEGE